MSRTKLNAAKRFKPYCHKLRVVALYKLHWGYGALDIPLSWHDKCFWLTERYRVEWYSYTQDAVLLEYQYSVPLCRHKRKDYPKYAFTLYCLLHIIWNIQNMCKIHGQIFPNLSLTLVNSCKYMKNYVINIYKYFTMNMKNISIMYNIL